MMTSRARATWPVHIWLLKLCYATVCVGIAYQYARTIVAEVSAHHAASTFFGDALKAVFVRYTVGIFSNDFVAFAAAVSSVQFTIGAQIHVLMTGGRHAGGHSGAESSSRPIGLPLLVLVPFVVPLAATAIRKMDSPPEILLWVATGLWLIWQWGMFIALILVQKGLPLAIHLALVIGLCLLPVREGLVVTVPLCVVLLVVTVFDLGAISICDGSREA